MSDKYPHLSALADPGEQEYDDDAKVEVSAHSEGI